MLPSPWIAHRARHTPDRIALEVSGKRLDYRALHELAAARAADLRSRGLVPGDIVAALLGNGLDFVVALHALDLAGGVLLPLNVRLTPRELVYPLADSGARLLLHPQGALAEKALATLASAPGVDAVCIERPAARPLPPRAPGDPTAGFVVLYTSGTTGRPKGVRLSRHNFMSSALGSALHLGVLPGDRWLACMPLFHVGGLSILVRSVIYGTTAVVHERFDPEAVDRALEHDGITLVSLTATMLQRLLDRRGERKAPTALRCLLLGGGPCPPQLLERALALGFPVAASYGLTETCSQVATHLPDDAALPILLSPLPGTELRVVNDAGVPLPPGQPGEILVRGGCVMSGYLDPAGTDAPVLRDGWLHTGDIGTLDEVGRLCVHDRRSDLIVSGGENVYPAEVELALLEHPAIAEAGVAGVDDPDYGSRPAAWYVAVPDATLPSDAALQAHCRKRLAGFKIPVAFHRVPELPRTPAGKLQRRLLRGGPRVRA